MRRKRFLLIATIIGVLIVICIWLQQVSLSIAHYSINVDIDESIRIIHLTDLHNKEFGKENNELVEEIAELKPDMVVMTGDMFNKDEDTKVVCRLIEKLKKIAPVYYSFGNDEMDWELGEQKELRLLLEEAGAMVLDFEYADVEVKGQLLRIGGYYGYYRTPHMRTDDPVEQEKDLVFATEFEDTDNVKVLLCHIPTAWLDWGYIDKYPVDVVFSGHYHGGQVRLPFIGGIYAPYAGVFPEYTKGIFEGECATCVLSAGLGSDSMIPRINNVPEILVVDLVPQD